MATLLQLKKDLTAAQGSAEAIVDGKSKKKEAGDKKAPGSDNSTKSPAPVSNSTPASGGQGDPAVVDKLTQSVAEQVIRSFLNLNWVGSLSIMFKFELEASLRRKDNIIV